MLSVSNILMFAAITMCLYLGLVLLLIGVRRQHRETVQQIDALQEEVRVLKSSVVTMGHQQSDLRGKLHLTQMRQQKMEQNEPVNQKIQYVQELIQAGVSEQELMERCRLSQAEARLLMTMHTQSKPEVSSAV